MSYLFHIIESIVKLLALIRANDRDTITYRSNLPPSPPFTHQLIQKFDLYNI